MGNLNSHHMRSLKVYNESKNEFYRIFPDDDIEFVNPVKYFKEFEIRRRAIIYRDILELEHPALVEEQDKLDNLFFERYAAKEVIIEMQNATDYSVPENFLKLLNSETKTQQRNLLKNQSINIDQLFSLIIKSSIEQNFLYSRYVSLTYPKNFDPSKLPLIAEKEDNGNINKIGNTELTDGKLNQLFEHRKSVTANFLDNGSNWHCLFITQRSLDSKESWNNDQPHFHYISDKWGLKREDVVSRIKSGRYPSTSVHIGIEQKQ